MLSSVQDGTYALGKARKYYALRPASQKFPQRHLRNSFNVRLSFNVPTSKKEEEEEEREKEEEKKRQEKKKQKKKKNVREESCHSRQVGHTAKLPGG